MAYFVSKVYQEFRENNPVTIVSYHDPPGKSETIKIKICNQIFLDPHKILNYNGTDVDSDSHNFLYQTLTGGPIPENSFRSYYHPFRDFYVMSEKVFETFKFDIDKFMLACGVNLFEKSCISDFKFYLEPHASCYEAHISNLGFGVYQYLEILLYFDPDLALYNFTEKLGAYVVISHVDEYNFPSEG